MGRKPYGERKPLNVEIGVRTRNIRDKAKYSREDFAELLDISPRFVYDYEVGASGISVETLKRFCELMGISSDRILWGDDSGAIPLEERMMHLDDETQRLLHKMLTTQLEIITLAKKLGKQEAEEEFRLKEQKTKKVHKILTRS